MIWLSNSRRWLKLFRVGFAISFVTCLLFGLGFVIHTKIFIRSALRANGLVMRMDERISDQDKLVQYAPVFEFLDNTGQNHTIASGTASSPPSFTVGQNVQVLYRNGQPDGAVIDSFGELWFMPMILFLIAIGQGIISGVCFLVEWKLDRNPQGALIQHPSGAKAQGRC